MLQLTTFGCLEVQVGAPPQPCLGRCGACRLRTPYCASLLDATR